ncbi:MAG: NAD(P)(+) transhydrogenase (Re/Si-specific) subunit beta [Candidatus Omnitrophica bacterium]|nr:NAD(P)(+) transhydrogenase (Re/Si-specific) subunit beta [Candidatus Omnitrophota bacterium]
MDRAILIDFSYIIASALFIFGIKRLSSVRTARGGNGLAALAMLIAIVATLFEKEIVDFRLIALGLVIGSLIGAAASHWVKMTAMPQMVALFNGFGGLASALVACSEYLRTGGTGVFDLTTICLGTFVGALTFTGSVMAYGKLEGIVEQQPVTYFLQKTLNLIIFIGIVVLIFWTVNDPKNLLPYWIMFAAASLLGVLLVLPIGGADMPVVISLLNSYSGIAASMTGFVLMNKVLIVAGALVGATGIILTEIMCRAMNRSLANVAFGTFGKIETGPAQKGGQDYAGVKSCSAEEAAMILEVAQKVVIVPGYGLAVARAQHAIHDLSNLLESRGVEVTYGIHPVAGRMPGHMNVLLAEANVPYDRLKEMDEINPEFDQTDVVLIVGANDVTNPVARSQPGSPIYGMPILDVDKAKSVIVIKRSLSPGFAGIKNPLFENEKTVMFFEDARKGIESITKELKNL